MMSLINTRVRWGNVQRLLCVIFLFSCALWMSGQGGGGVTVTNATSTPQTQCQANGTITVTVANPQNKSLGYQLLWGTGQTQVNYQASNKFTNVPAGDFKVNVVDANNHGLIYASKSVTVANNYASISKVNVSLEGLCGSFKPGAIIKVDRNSIVGGTAPYTYCFVKDDNPNFADDPSQYSSNPQFTAPDFGKYQVRIKDKCGATKTVTMDVQPTLARVKVQNYPRNNRTCQHDGKAELFNIGLYNPETNGRVDFGEYTRLGGVKIELRENDEHGQVLMSGILKDGHHRENASKATQDYLFKIASSHKYWAKITTPCGQEYKGPFDMKTEPDFWPKAISSGCGFGEGMVIANTGVRFLGYPAKVYITKVGETAPRQVIPVRNDDEALFKSNVLPFGNYKVEIKNDCGGVAPQPRMIYNVKGDLNFRIVYVDYSLGRCDGQDLFTRENGTVDVAVEIGGYVPDQEHMEAKIIAGPSNVGVKALYKSWTYRWYNMKPGKYKIQFTSCGETRVLEHEFNPNKVLRQSLVSTATSKCVGGGSIQSVPTYNGGFSTTVELLDERGIPIRENGEIKTSTNGSFSNIPPGTYNTRMVIYPWCGDQKPYYVYNERPLVITDGQTGAQFKSLIGVVCENAQAGGQRKGTLYMQLAATDDAQLSYRKVGSQTWIELPYANYVEIPNLDIATYEVRLGSCGNFKNQTVTISPITPALSDNQAHPCLNNSYRLAMPYYHGATYLWTKNGQTLSTRHYVDFDNFTEADNGEYQCKIQWGTCVTRIVNYALNANLCGTNIGKISLEGTVFDDQNGLSDGAVNGNPIGSVDGQQLYIHVLMLKNGSYQHVGTRTPVGANGKFAIPGLSANSKYRLILTTSEAPVTSSTPIQRWNFVGEYYQNTGSDGTPDGVLELNVGTGSMLDLRFGLRRASALRTNRHITTKL